MTSAEPRCGGANVLVPFHEVYAVRTREGRSIGLPQLSYSAFVSPARNRATGAVGHVHWFTSTEDAAGVPGNTATPRSPAQRQRLLVDRGSVALGDGGGVWTLSR
jgi:hypothetical protein